MMKFIAIVVLVGVAFADQIPSNLLKKSAFPDGRIIGGDNAAIVEVPYQVSIGVKGSHYCGGSIIAKNWILTAGHCATLSPIRYRIRAGSDHSHIGGSLHRVSLIIIHENYTVNIYGTPTNDIALFRVDAPFFLDATRQPIELYESNEETEVGMYSVVTGWGTISPSSIVIPKRLQTVSVPIISKNECKKAYSSMTKFSPGQICAAYPEGGKDACQGDSGGPLVVNDRLAGVVSWGNGCAAVGMPGVYTEVAYFRQWIDKSIINA